MTEDVIEWYDTFNTNECPYEFIFGDFNYQPITYNYYNDLNDDYGNGKNISGTPTDNVFTDNKGVEYTVAPND